MSGVFVAQPEQLADCIEEFTELVEGANDDVVIGPGGLPFTPPVQIDTSLYLSAEAAGVVSFALALPPF